MAARTIFITGAASGIGLATAKHFAARGWTIGLADIDEPGLARALEAMAPGAHTAHRLDVRDRAAWAAVLEGFVKAHGRLDVLVNNAGIARMGALEVQTDADVDGQIDINLKGVINGCRAGLPHLKATPGSVLVNLASVAGLVATGGMSVYAATKFAVRGLSDSLSLEWAPHGVGVRCIMPWFLETPLLDKAGGNQDLRGFLKAGGLPIYGVEEASEGIWAAVHGNGVHHMVGKQARRVAFMARFAPGLLRKLLTRTSQA